MFEQLVCWLVVLNIVFFRQTLRLLVDWPAYFSKKPILRGWTIALLITAAPSKADFSMFGNNDGYWWLLYYISFLATMMVIYGCTTSKSSSSTTVSWEQSAAGCDRIPKKTGQRQQMVVFGTFRSVTNPLAKIYLVHGSWFRDCFKWILAIDTLSFWYPLFIIINHSQP